MQQRPKPGQYNNPLHDVKKNCTERNRHATHDSRPHEKRSPMEANLEEGSRTDRALCKSKHPSMVMAKTP